MVLVFLFNYPYFFGVDLEFRCESQLLDFTFGGRPL